MTIDQQIEAVQQWLNFAEAWRQSNGDDPRLQDYADQLRSNAQQQALEEIRRLASPMLEDDFTREAGEGILAEIEGAGL